jgi:hypothetical protein
MITAISDDKSTLQKNIEKQASAGSTLELRYIDSIIGQYFIADGNEAMFVATTEAEGQASILWTNNDSFIAFLERSFEDMWSKSVSMVPKPSKPAV